MKKGMGRRTAHTITPKSTRHVSEWPVTILDVQDYYGQVRYRPERVIIRAVHGMMERYLRVHPELQFDSHKNPIKRIIYLPEGIRAWTAYMPGGFATFYAYSPHVRQMKNGTKTDPVTAAFFRHSYDSVGLRTRSHIMGWLAGQTLQSTSSPMTWMSIAGGTGRPVFDALVELPAEDAKRTRLVIVDSDSAALEFADTLARHESVPIKSFTTHEANVTDEDTMTGLLTTYRPKIIDAMGLFEYLGEDEAVKLLVTLYNQLASGGVIIFTNMTPHHPHLEVHKRGLGWPGVQQRTIRAVQKILAQTTIPMSAVDVFHDTERVYDIYRIMKP